MQNLKINGTPTPYWCVVVPVDAEDILIFPKLSFAHVRYFVPDTHETIPYDLCIINTNIKFNRGKALKLLGCITLSGMDEGVKEVAKSINDWGLSPYMDFTNVDVDSYCFQDWKDSVKSLLTHNQITLTTETKAVVVKQKL